MNTGDVINGHSQTDTSGSIRFWLRKLYVLDIGDTTMYTSAIRNTWCGPTECEHREWDGQHKNKTCELSSNLGKKTVKVIWGYAYKRNEKNEIVSYKAKLIAKGYDQQQGIYYSLLWALVATSNDSNQIAGYVIDSVVSNNMVWDWIFFASTQSTKGWLQSAMDRNFEFTEKELLNLRHTLKTLKTL